ncbi:MAG: hypothetical protein IJC78_05375 [Clostridia bacterium]|nr:hypothetical protein [Clostridia bacterium]
MNNNGGNLIEIDGIYCQKCNTLHPTLFWHEKYDDYINQSDYIDSITEAYKRFGTIISNEGAYKNFVEYLLTLEIDKIETEGKCVVCSAKTSFINKRTNHYVCSDVCKYTDNSEN